MTVRPPQAYRKQITDDPVTAALEQEVLAEKAGTLARLNTKLEQALARIPDATQNAGEDEQRKRALRIAEAGEALWHVTIQRELCGFLRHKAFFDHMGVPAAVRLSAGPVPEHLKAREKGK
ncbi:hypothetical protein DYI23_09710 [Roseibium polysiphoniae]|uniref:Uncharacterized protein n=1 Tax=Roseibium polysiphoniae TaxID=2571221 RepID=A0A944CDE9_9HYPH|nr:DUF6665 family protein [Roseibium polysiphoniae]MBS8260492.1 hypothetical protein [Roseibium polysiphoniae]